VEFSAEKTFKGFSAFPAPQGANRVNQTSNGTVVRMKSMQGNAIRAVTTNNLIGNQYEPSPLVFRCRAESCFLAEVWAGETHGGALALSSREKELAQSGPAPRLAVIRIAPVSAMRRLVCPFGVPSQT